jgi:hypothetical protein
MDALVHGGANDSVPIAFHAEMVPSDWPWDGNSGSK